MQVRAEINNFDEVVDKLEYIEKKVNNIVEKVDSIGFIGVKELAKAMGCSENSAREVFNSKDFPVYDGAKKKIAEIEAVKKFFSVPRKKENNYQ